MIAGGHSPGNLRDSIPDTRTEAKAPDRRAASAPHNFHKCHLPTRSRSFCFKLLVIAIVLVSNSRPDPASCGWNRTTLIAKTTWIQSWGRV